MKEKMKTKGKSRVEREKWESNFSEWFSSILEQAEILDIRYPIKGTYVWLPYGFKIRAKIIEILRKLHDETGHEEALFPLLIPEHEFMKEAKHVKGFEDEVYWVTHGGLKELDVKLAVRPTSETAIYPMFALWIRSHKDMPLKVYQVVNVFRYETKATKPLIRLREITTFKEAHTAHASREEAEAQVREAIAIYKKLFEKLCIPYIISRRPDWDKFPGADYTIAFDTVLPDGKSLQIATVHNLAQNFSKTFEIKFENIEGRQEYAYQTCYGVSDRIIASALALHGDDTGLCLLPSIAPIQVIIVPIPFEGAEERIESYIREVEKILEKKKIRYKADFSEKTPGNKFYFWERRGVPLRIEIGPKEAENREITLALRATRERRKIKFSELESKIESIFSEIEEIIRKRAKEFFKSKISYASTIEEAKNAIEKNKGIVKASWCGSEACAEELEKSLDARLLGIDENEKKEGACIICNAETENVLNIARAY